MKSVLLSFLIVGIILVPVAYAEDVQDDMKLIEGTWGITELVVNGNVVKEEDFKKISVVNGADSTWSLRVEGKEISRGTNVFDPKMKPKTIDFYPTDGEGKNNKYLGIYELSENTRKLCFVESGKNRPNEFRSDSGSERILITFERMKKE